jgi:hypothetical protein
VVPGLLANDAFVIVSPEYERALGDRLARQTLRAGRHRALPIERADKQDGRRV